MERIIEKELSYTKLYVRVNHLGKDYHLTLWGGEKPHIGCTVLSVPRPSLTGKGDISVTSSVLNVIGHKDEEICRCLAEQVARKKNAVTVCTGGFHMDGITDSQIDEVCRAVRETAQEL